MNINQHLSNMHNYKDVKEKGTEGEYAALEVLKGLREEQGGCIFHSYTYPVDKSLPGNIIRHGETLSLNPLGSITEIDLLYITNFRIFVIEVKSYHSNNIILKDQGIYGCNSTEKSPIHQNEMHCRHLYSNIYRCIPDGDPNYIVSLTCFVDESRVKDERSKEQRFRYFITNLNRLKSAIEVLNKPLDYKLDLKDVYQTLLDISSGSEKILPPITEV